MKSYDYFVTLGYHTVETVEPTALVHPLVKDFVENEPIFSPFLYSEWW